MWHQLRKKYFVLMVKRMPWCWIAAQGAPYPHAEPSGSDVATVKLVVQLARSEIADSACPLQRPDAATYARLLMSWRDQGKTDDNSPPNNFVNAVVLMRDLLIIEPSAFSPDDITKDTLTRAVFAEYMHLAALAGDSKTATRRAQASRRPCVCFLFAISLQRSTCPVLHKMQCM